MLSPCTARSCEKKMKATPNNHCPSQPSETSQSPSFSPEGCRACRGMEKKQKENP